MFDDVGNNSGGFYAIEPEIPSISGAKALIMGVPLALQEIVQPQTTLDDKRLLYLFGTAWTEMSVTGLLLLGEQDTMGAQLSQLLSWYNTNRVSVKKGPISVSLGTSGLDAFVIGLRLAEANPRNNSQAFSIMLVTADTES